MAPPADISIPAGLAEKANTTPITFQYADGDRPLDTRRIRDEETMFECGFVKATVSEYFDKVFPNHANIPKRRYEEVKKLNTRYLKSNKSRVSRDTEVRSYPDLVEFINSVGGTSNYVCKDVADWSDLSLQDRRRMDLGIFKTDSRSQDFWLDPNLEPGATCIEERRVHAARNCASQSVLGGEVKVSPDRKAFGEKATDPLLPTAKAAQLARAQICGYASDILTHQHRLFLPFFYIYRTTARLLLFDRGAVLVSDPIDLEKDWKTFAKFFYCVKTASDVTLGFDPTVTMLPKNSTGDVNYKALQTALASLPANSRVAPYIRKAFEDGSSKFPFYKVAVDKGSETSHFLVRNLSSHSLSITGRATRGYIAFDIAEKTFHFLKDSWRPDSDLIHTELKIYEDLKANSVRNVATVLCGGDVCSVPTVSQKTVSQKTVTHYFREGTDNVLCRVHTRLVLKEIGIPLRHYLDSKELSTVVGHAFIAHMDAYMRAKLLHRDISDGNIVLYEPTPGKPLRGLLIDWDLSKYLEQLKKKPTQRSRSGTWRYISAMLLNYPLKSNKLADDIESFYHLLIILALRYHDHNKSGQEVKAILEDYDHCEYRYGYWVGGSTKLDNVSDGRIPFKLAHEDTFKSLLVSLAELLKQHYASKDKKVLEQRYGIPELPAQTKPAEAATSIQTPVTPSEPSAAEEAPAAEDVDDEFADFATADSGVQLTVLKEQPAPERPVSPLKDHTQFLALLSQAIRDKDWTASDKGADKFALIDWTATRDSIR
ncbi:hypothetical protein EIP91_010864, partial [Steccherinum ochraceum]